MIYLNSPLCRILEAIGISCSRNQIAGISARFFFSERVINAWNKFPAGMDFSSLSKFKRILAFMDFPDYLHCF